MNAARLRPIDVRTPLLAAAIASALWLSGGTSRGGLIYTLTAEVTLEAGSTYLYMYDLTVAPDSTIGRLDAGPRRIRLRRPDGALRARRLGRLVQRARRPAPLPVPPTRRSTSGRGRRGSCRTPRCSARP